MDHLSTFFAMGGYAAFVWPAYGAAALVLAVFAVDSWRRVKVAEEALRRFEGQPQNTARRATSGGTKTGGTTSRASASAAQEDGAAR